MLAACQSLRFWFTVIGWRILIQDSLWNIPENSSNLWSTTGTKGIKPTHQNFTLSPQISPADNRKPLSRHVAPGISSYIFYFLSHTSLATFCHSTNFFKCSALEPLPLATTLVTWEVGHRHHTDTTGPSFTLKTAKANAEAPVNFAARPYQVRPGNDP